MTTHDYKTMINIDNRHRRLQSALRDLADNVNGKAIRFAPSSDPTFASLPDRTREQISFYRDASKFLAEVRNQLTVWQFMGII